MRYMRVSKLVCLLAKEGREKEMGGLRVVSTA